MAGSSNTGLIGQPVARVDVWDKASAEYKYTNDVDPKGMLHAKLVTSTYAHAVLKSVDTSEAWKVSGVRAIVTGDVFPYHIGPILADRQPLAVGKVRYFGEPIAIVVADKEHQAKRAAKLVRIEYDPLPVVNSPYEAFQSLKGTIHEQSGQYTKIVESVHPVPGTHIANHIKIRKGDVEKAWNTCTCVVEQDYSLNVSDHAALEPRCARVQILQNGQVIVHSTTQSPFSIKKLFNQFFNIDVGNVIVHVAMVGGAFGGKGTIQLEPIAYLASQAVRGRMVSLAYEREEDICTAPGRVGLQATLKLGTDANGHLRAAKITFYFDGGAYSDQAAGITRAAAIDCTGPYDIANVWCDSYCLYTNHPYGTSFRGYGHPELTFAMDRTMDVLARKLGMDPLELRAKNLLKPGDSTPTHVVLTKSNIGDVKACLARAQELLQWDQGQRVEMPDGTIRAKGVACFWKTSTTPPNGQAGAILTFDADGSVNLNVATVEFGQGTKTALTQILAEKLRINIQKIRVTIDVDTAYNPHEWRTVASTGTFLAGRAVIQAADDAIRQLKQTAAIVLQCAAEDLDYDDGKVFVKDSPSFYVEYGEIALGYKYPSGHAVMGQVIGSGKYIQKHLTGMDPKTGFGKPGPWWSVGVQGVEVAWNPRDNQYRILKAVTVLDGGTIINVGTATQQMRGGMFMGLSYASCETLQFDDTGRVLNPQLRTYKVLRFGEQPDEYVVDFVQTPCIDGPFGARGIGEYGVIGMPAALANGLSVAAGVDLNHLPLTPEEIWRARGVRGSDRV
ncbi:xanthine dehydrogenase family protein molybdopterin-binding subunit [Ferroacidibacillus organovorans]|uniref:Aldehyde oxidase n=1 Tax=Ferroacidibacillus organovorans TaxID=1765683 RepID=A0A853K9S7_9BACL|nr:xanthine dehydrogenase family protein molybdopterin-binding subunit [Ferroacidibacillus organovorans]KYP81110.1 aldehyde oxidase [Ferroacidibacillus organovorans]OAG93812.1 aldehyde oxidase [Ferroacidibacillus organovorans]